MASGDPDFFREMAAEAADMTFVPTEQNQARLRKMATRVVEVERRIKELEDEKKLLNVELYELQHKSMPDLMTEVGVDKIGLPESNADLVLKPYYKANISAEWPEEQRNAAFEHLDYLGLGDIVKNTITVVFPKGWDEERQEWLEKVRGLNLSFDPPEMVETRVVPWNTLTATIKEQYETGKEEFLQAVDLKLLGAEVGQIVNIKPRK